MQAGSARVRRHIAEAREGIACENTQQRGAGANFDHVALRRRPAKPHGIGWRIALIRGFTRFRSCGAVVAFNGDGVARQNRGVGKIIVAAKPKYGWKRNHPLAKSVGSDSRKRNRFGPIGGKIEFKGRIGEDAQGVGCSSRGRKRLQRDKVNAWEWRIIERHRPVKAVRGVGRRIGEQDCAKVERQCEHSLTCAPNMVRVGVLNLAVHGYEVTFPSNCREALTSRFACVSRDRFKGPQRPARVDADDKRRRNNSQGRRSLRRRCNSDFHFAAQRSAPLVPYGSGRRIALVRRLTSLRRRTNVCTLQRNGKA